MATQKKQYERLNGNSKNDLKRVEIYLTNGAYNKLEKMASLDGRSTKKFIETIVNEKLN